MLTWAGGASLDIAASHKDPWLLVKEVKSMKTKLFAVFLGVLILASGCASLSFPVSDTVEKINWREYEEC